MARFEKFKDAKSAGMRFGVHVLNQKNRADDGWHYFETRAEAEEFVITHPDRLNKTRIDSW